MVPDSLYHLVNSIPSEIKEIILFLLLLATTIAALMGEYRLRSYAKRFEEVRSRLDTLKDEINKEREAFDRVQGLDQPFSDMIGVGDGELKTLSKRVGFESSEFFYDIKPSLIDISDSLSLKDGLCKIAKKYAIDTVSITSEDGFLIESSGECNEGEAAMYSFILQEMVLVGDNSNRSLAVGNGVSCLLMDLDDVNVVCILQAEKTINPDREDLRTDLNTIIERFVGAAS